jgi:hypothetical protein
MRDDEVSQGRDCICPEVNRNKNIGEVRRRGGGFIISRGSPVCWRGGGTSWLPSTSRLPGVLHNAGMHAMDPPFSRLAPT